MARIQKAPAKKVPVKTEPTTIVPVQDNISFFGEVEDTAIDVLRSGKNVVSVVGNITEALNEAMLPVLMELRGDTLETEVKTVQRVYDLGYDEDEAIRYITTGRR
jgi:hypothetical protein